MDQQATKCKNVVTYSYIERYDWETATCICGDNGRYCDDCEEKLGIKQKNLDYQASKNNPAKQEEKVDQKTYYCGQQEGLEICQAIDGKEYQCYSCRKKELKLLDKKH